MRTNLTVLGIGVVFGFAFSASGFNQYNVIHRMLSLQIAGPYLVMASAVLIAMPTLWYLERRHWVTPLGGEMRLRRWSPERKHVLGGIVFGLGWAVTGACPGTIPTALAGGCLLAIVPAIGVLAGIFLHDGIVEHTSQRDPAAGSEVWSEA